MLFVYIAIVDWLFLFEKPRKRLAGRVAGGKGGPVSPFPVRFASFA